MNGSVEWRKERDTSGHRETTEAGREVKTRPQSGGNGKTRSIICQFRSSVIHSVHRFPPSIVPPSGGSLITSLIPPYELPSPFHLPPLRGAAPPDGTEGREHVRHREVMRYTSVCFHLHSHSLAALGSSSSFLISWSNRSSVSQSLPSLSIINSGHRMAETDGGHWRWLRGGS